MKARYEANKESIRAQQKDYNEARRAANPEKFREKVRESMRRWRLREDVREKGRAASRMWGRNNPDKVRARCARRRALKSLACPAWVDRKAIEAIYEGCPEGHAIDHISPLKGRHWSGKWELGDSLLWLLELPDDAEDLFGNPISTRVSIGLHVPLNLMPLPDEENLSKGNQAPQPGYMDWFGHSLVNGLHPIT
jgi:hypothetical protein